MEGVAEEVKATCRGASPDEGSADAEQVRVQDGDTVIVPVFVQVTP